MKFTTIVSTVLCLGAAQLVAATETQTSTVTTIITKTLVRVNALTAAATPTSSTPLIHTSTPVASSTLVSSSTAAATPTIAPSDEPIHTGAAASFGGNMPVALAGGMVALLFGTL
ncbi:hypothetical protein BDW75DRAFT_238144 [Aspergillus navahoensis]